MVVPATIRSDRLGRCEIRIRNISRNGIGARSRTAMPEIGERLFVTINEIGEIEGTVRWVRGDQFGVLLDSELDAALFDRSADERDIAPATPGFSFAPDD
jgi:hypothetical protein